MEKIIKWYETEKVFPPHLQTVLVDGGLARYDHRKQTWLSGTEEPLFQKEIEWIVYCWAYIPNPPSHLESSFVKTVKNLELG